ncbi:MAG: AraC family transcriptional regulator [Colwellia sp.]|nr:AraC family transcriptional regulator [Colwellia sp.]
MNHLQQSLTLTEITNNLLNKSDLPASLTIEHCASLLSMSMTSFRRKLAQEEASYKLIQSKFLNELCVHALLTKFVKIDELAFKLGYSERATFERAFKQKFGITPSQFRELSMIGNKKDNQQTIIKIAQNMPPMPESCQQLLREKDQNSLDISRVVLIIEKILSL